MGVVVTGSPQEIARWIHKFELVELPAIWGNLSHSYNRRDGSVLTLTSPNRETYELDVEAELIKQELAKLNKRGESL